MLEAARLLSARHPGLHFEVSAANTRVAVWMMEYLKERNFDPAFCRIGLDRFYPLAQEATVGMVCSGTATLEAAYFGLPMLITYKVAPLTFFIAKMLVRIPFLGMPNVLAGRQIAPEFIQYNATPSALFQAMEALLNDSHAREAQQNAFRSVIASLGAPGAGARAADAITRFLER
jgi:lipid-A-disaccharide synthase